MVDNCWFNIRSLVCYKSYSCRINLCVLQIIYFSTRNGQLSWGRWASSLWAVPFQGPGGQDPSQLSLWVPHSVRDLWKDQNLESWGRSGRSSRQFLLLPNMPEGFLSILWLTIHSIFAFSIWFLAFFNGSLAGSSLGNRKTNDEMRFLGSVTA